jgi:hypothetical protein
VHWAPVAGATAAEVDEAAGVAVTPVTTYPALGTLSTTQHDDNAVDVTIPGGGRISSLTLTGLKQGGGGELVSSGGLQGAAGGALRLAVSAVDAGGQVRPLCVVPALGARGVLPAPLTGATFASRVLELPDVRATKLRLSLVRGDEPQSLSGVPTRVGGVQGTATLISSGLTLKGPDGTAVWSSPAELPAAGQVVSLATRLRLALNAALAAGTPPDVTFLLTGAPGMRAGVATSALHGALVRAASAIPPIVLEGDAVPLALGDGPLAAEAPASAVADVTLTYAGIRLHDVVRDPLPAAPGGVAGAVVGETAVVRALPPAALDGPPLVRAAPVGRAPEGCSLSVRLVDLSAGPPGVPLGAPGAVELPASPALAAPWVELPQVQASGVPVGIAVRATSGRFLWAAAGDGTPLLRLAVSDPDPGGRPVKLGGSVLVTLTETELQARALALPAAALHGAPAFSSDLFCTLELADLTLRYAR